MRKNKALQTTQTTDSIFFTQPRYRKVRRNNFLCVQIGTHDIQEEPNTFYKCWNFITNSSLSKNLRLIVKKKLFA